MQFQFPINIVCVVIVFLGGATLGQSPFTVIQLLWINLIMDTLAAISLATEPPSSNADNWGLEERRQKQDKIILPSMWRNIMVQTVYQLIVMIVMLYSVNFWFGVPFKSVEHFTILFHTFVLMNLFNQFACRKLSWGELNIFSEIFNNLWFLIIVTAEFVLQFCYVQYFNFLFNTEPLTWQMHLACYSFGVGALLFNLASKKIFEDKEKYFKYFEIDFNEANEKRSNPILNITDGLTSKMQPQKSGVERLLDSVSSI